MTRAEKFELLSIPVVVMICWLLRNQLPATTTVGRVFLYSSAILLFQGLIRDLWLLSHNKALRGNNQTPPRRCLCLESTVGVTGIIAGAAILGAGLDQVLGVPLWGWGCLAAGVMTLGYVIKDVVVEFSPLRIYRDPGHVSIVVSWKR